MSCTSERVRQHDHFCNSRTQIEEVVRVRDGPGLRQISRFWQWLPRQLQRGPFVVRVRPRRYKKVVAQGTVLL